MNDNVESPGDCHDMAAPTLDAAVASRFVATALDNVEREYPNKLDHVLGGADDLRPPRVLHPTFYGSYDWHSCVHMFWMIAHIRRLHPEIAAQAGVDALFERRLSREAIAAEVAYLAGPHARSFERTYGWAWLLKFAEEIGRCGDAFGGNCASNLAPLADAFAARYLEHLPKAGLPLRTGMHANSAFGLAFAFDYAQFTRHERLQQACEDTARRWYLADRGYPAQWEPSGADFLSPALMEADMMRRVLPPEAFPLWLDGFLPRLARNEPASLLSPVEPGDRSDGQIVHLDGLNLSRAWCARAIAQALPHADPRRKVLAAAASRHVEAGMRGVDSADYLGTHWLASFAVLALTGA